MEVYFGGAFQGKLSYVLHMKGNIESNAVADGKYCNLDELKDMKVLNHLHLLIKRYLDEGRDVRNLIDEIYNINPDMILICDEVGNGIVPIERKDRIYRETVGRILCAAVNKSDIVERVMCGIGQRLK